MLEWLDSALSVSSLPIVAFAAILIGEIALPRRLINVNPLPRWLGNTGLFLINSIAIVGLAPVGTSVLDSFGLRADLLGASLGPGMWTAVGQVAGIVVLDLMLYLLHRLNHRMRPLWRFHAVHHADTTVDSTTAVRHHPGEYLINNAMLALVMAALGVSAIAIGAYGIVLLTLQMMQHANIRFPQRLDRILRHVLVTPEVHRIHHSVTPAEGNSNFGAVLSIWDRLWRTYLDPTEPHSANIEYGVTGMNDPRYQRLDWMLLKPVTADNAPMAPSR